MLLMEINNALNDSLILVQFNRLAEYNRINQ